MASINNLHSYNIMYLFWSLLLYSFDNNVWHNAIENVSDPIGYLLDFTNPYYTALAGNMKARAKKDNSFWNHT